MNSRREIRLLLDLVDSPPLLLLPSPLPLSHPSSPYSLSMLFYNSVSCFASPLISLPFSLPRPFAPFSPRCPSRPRRFPRFSVSSSRSASVISLLRSRPSRFSAPPLLSLRSPLSPSPPPLLPPPSPPSIPLSSRHPGTPRAGRRGRDRGHHQRRSPARGSAAATRLGGLSRAPYALRVDEHLRRRCARWSTS